MYTQRHEPMLRADGLYSQVSDTIGSCPGTEVT